MSRRGRGRRQQRQAVRSLRDKAHRDWVEWRQQLDQALAEQLVEDVRRLGQRPGWRMRKAR